MAAEHGSNDAYFLLVASREVAYVFSLPHNFATHKMLETFKALGQHLRGECAHGCNEVEIFFRREKVDEKTAVDEGTCVALPFFVEGWVYADNVG